MSTSCNFVEAFNHYMQRDKRSASMHDNEKSCTDDERIVTVYYVSLASHTHGTTI
jgi:hypothetical protein